jgi:hypothetical protein
LSGKIATLVAVVDAHKFFRLGSLATHFSARTNGILTWIGKIAALARFANFGKTLGGVNDAGGG